MELLHPKALLGHKFIANPAVNSVTFNPLPVYFSVLGGNYASLPVYFSVLGGNYRTNIQNTLIWIVTL